MSTATLAYKDAEASMPEVITLTQIYDDTTTVGTSTTTVTGTATFTWNRVRVADQATCPRLPLSDGNYAPGKGEFVAIQLAVGKVPGWKMIFGDQDPVTNAFTSTTTAPGHSPLVSHQDAFCIAPFVYCSQVAPGWTTLGFDASRENGVLGFNLGFDPNTLVFGDPVPYTVELIQAGVAATDQQAAIPPVYRVTIPSEAGYYTEFTGFLDGAEFFGGSGAGGPGRVDDLLPLALASVGTVSPLSPWVCDVQLHALGSILTAGTVTFAPLTPYYSRVIIAGDATEDDSSGFTIKEIAPFALAGQSFTAPPGDNGLTVTVNF